MDKEVRGLGQSMLIIFKFFNIIIKSANMDKGGGSNAYPQNVNKKTFYYPSLTQLVWKYLQDTFTLKPFSARDLIFRDNVHLPPHVMCHMLSHVSHVMFHVSHVTCDRSQRNEKNGEKRRWS